VAHRSLKFVAPWLVLSLWACAPSLNETEVPVGNGAGPRSNAGAPHPVAPSGARHKLPDRDWESLASQRFGFRLPLPDAGRWDEVADERWLTLVHRPTQSTLRLRTWRAAQRVTKEECREQVYLWRSELRPAADPVAEGALGAPAGFDVGVRIDLFAEGSQGRRALALAFGAAVRRCYAASFEPSLAGVDEAELGARLRLITEGVFERVEVLGIEAFATPEPEPPP
jgi:hypothetical protein